MFGNAWNDIANWGATFHKVSSPCLDDHQKKKEELKNTGELAQVSSHIVLKCLNLARIRRPGILWSVKDWQDLSQNGHTLVTHDWHG